MYQPPQVGHGTQPVVLRRVLLPSVILAAGLGLAAGAVPAAAASVSAGVVFGLWAVLGVSFGLTWLRCTFEIRPGRLTVRGVLRRTTVDLSALVSAEVALIAPRSGRPFALRLCDQQGKTALLDLGNYPEAKRRLALAALAPYIMAPGVQRNGRVSAGLDGSLWRR